MRLIAYVVLKAVYEVPYMVRQGAFIRRGTLLVYPFIHPYIYLHQATWPISQEKLGRRQRRRVQKTNSANVAVYCRQKCLEDC